MATFTDLSELDGYEIPASGETIEINIAENYYGAYELYGTNITDFNAEDGNQVGEVVTEANLFRFYNLDGEGEGVTITFEVGQNTEQSPISFYIAFYDTEDSPLGDYIFYQEEGEPPAPTPSDGQHKIYRSGQQVMKMYRSGELIYLRLNPAEADYRAMPLTFEITGPGVISFGSTQGQRTIQYKLNDGDWTTVTCDIPSDAPSIRVAAGDTVQFRGDNQEYQGGIFSGTTAQYKVKGNIMSLLSGTGFETLTSIDYGQAFVYFFRSQSGLTDASQLVLPATTLSYGCYDNMFRDCTSLISAPALPATTLAIEVYYAMFQGCTSLTSAPALPATTLGLACYNRMFRDCTSLTSAPALPATTLAESCYYRMFSGCTSLTTAPELPATTLVENCYFRMFQGCPNLSYIRCLATDITASNCTYEWVDGVASDGTFIKPAEMDDWAVGVSGIPSGWTVLDAE